MTEIHIHRAKDQPATRFVIQLDTTKLVERHPRRRCLPARCCRRQRIAANLVAHVYYDGTWFYCRPGKGCR